jgi:8-oxo-dGTP diphosphatase
MTAAADDFPIEVVAAAIVRSGLVLAAQRSHPDTLRGQWEFPGGKVQSGENRTEALHRECWEELGVRVCVGEQLGTDVSMTLPDRRPAVLALYECTLQDERENPRNIEHSALRWLAGNELANVEWLVTNRHLLTWVARRVRWSA